MDDRQIKVEPYRFGYQGQYAEKDSLANRNAFQLRMYEPRFGRWLSTDPNDQFSSAFEGMGNDPVTGIDVDGGYIYFMRNGANIKDWLKAFNMLYSADLGRKLIRKYINDPHNHIFFETSGRRMESVYYPGLTAGGTTRKGHATSNATMSDDRPMHPFDRFASSELNSFDFTMASKSFVESMGHEGIAHFAISEALRKTGYTSGDLEHEIFGSNHLLINSTGGTGWARQLADQLRNQNINTLQSQFNFLCVGTGVFLRLAFSTSFSPKINVPDIFAPKSSY